MQVPDGEVSGHCKQEDGQEEQKDQHCGLEVQDVVVEYLAGKVQEVVSDFLPDLKNGDALDCPEHADHAQHVGQKYKLFGEYLEEFQAYY